MYKSLKIEQADLSHKSKKAITMKEEKSNTTHIHIPLSSNCYGLEVAVKEAEDRT